MSFAISKHAPKDMSSPGANAAAHAVTAAAAVRATSRSSRYPSIRQSRDLEPLLGEPARQLVRPRDRTIQRHERARLSNRDDDRRAPHSRSIGRSPAPRASPGDTSWRARDAMFFHLCSGSRVWSKSSMRSSRAPHRGDGGAGRGQESAAPAPPFTGSSRAARSLALSPPRWTPSQPRRQSRRSSTARASLRGHGFRPRSPRGAAGEARAVDGCEQ
jgi:hypothetical protein